ncbi:phosphoglycerate mutase [Starmerella bacillaris]|uniref:Phosphoglycerate mutase n=1 Tax=Starmerella bacillaris TaxID=1247836 RepID=A0AAV5RM57_STABA|nr:phosphoglycerate mutase [Starmerella bacillaris]
MRVIFLRHGETTSNAEGRMQGQYDTELNTRGEDQARIVGKALRSDEKIDAVYSSDLKRAYRTAQIVADGKWEITPVPKLRERFMGKFQNVLRVEATKIAAAEGKKITDYGESGQELTARMMEGYLEVLADAESKGYKTILIVSHGSALTHLFKEIAKDPKYKVSEDMHDSIYGNSKMGNCSVTIINDNEFEKHAAKMIDSMVLNVDDV